MDLTALKALAYDKAVMIQRLQNELVSLNRTIAEHSARTIVKSQQAEPVQTPDKPNPEKTEGDKNE